MTVLRTPRTRVRCWLSVLVTNLKITTAPGELDALADAYATNPAWLEMSRISPNSPQLLAHMRRMWRV